MIMRNKGLMPKQVDTSMIKDCIGVKEGVDEDEIRKGELLIQETLDAYGIRVEKITAEPRLSAVYYEVFPSKGFGFLELKKHLYDFSVSLGSIHARILVPVPGKVAIGIEFPRTNPQLVSGKEFFDSEVFSGSEAILPIVFGKTHLNQYYVSDLTRMHHILIAGDTGMGKTMCLKSMIVGLLYKKRSSELKLVLIDTKRVEFNVFTSLDTTFFAKEKNIDTDIITGTMQSIRMINALKMEMDKRYDLLRETGTSNIEDYNEKQFQNGNEEGCHCLPYIVVVIDEFADLMLTSRKEMEEPLVMLATLSHRVGIHLIMSTQRPTTNIVTGSILVNFPIRVAFKMTTPSESRRVIGRDDAVCLIGNGDMFISMPSNNELIRCQGACLSDSDTANIVRFINGQNGCLDDEYHLPMMDEGKEE